MHHGQLKSIARWLTIGLIVSFGAGSARGEESAAVYEITYVAYELVYLNGGRDDGLAVGDRAIVTGDGLVTAELEVAHVAAHSASCRVLRQDLPLVIGDSVYVTHAATFGALTPDTIATSGETTGLTFGTTRSSGDRPVGRSARRMQPQVRGRVGVQSSRWIDDGDSDLDYTQSSVRLSLTARHLWWRGLSFTLRSSSRHNRRNRAYSASVPQAAWTHNIYEGTLSYTGDRIPLNIHLGRISLRRVAGLGRLDGLLIEHQASKRLYLGLLAGVHPQWQYGATGTALRKYGGYLSYEQGSQRTAFFGMTIGAAAEYHGATVSREILYLQGHVRLVQRLSVSHNLEFDINRGWRQEATGEGVALTSAHADARYQFTKRLTGSVNYDNRKNYRTYDTRSVADSLFDDNLRQGWRTRWEIRLPAGMSLHTNLGLRTRDDNPEPTYSYSAGMRKRGLPLPGSVASFNLARFHGASEEGYNATARISHTAGRGIIVGLGYSAYGYSTRGAGARANRRFDLSLRARLARGVAANAQYQQSTGNDTVGHRLRWGIAYGF